MSKKLPTIYAFSSDSFSELNKKVETIEKSADFEVETFDFSQLKEEDAIGKIFDSLGSPSFFNEARLTVVKNCQDITKSDLEIFGNNIKQLADENTLVCLFAANKIPTIWTSLIKELNINVDKSKGVKVEDILNTSQLNFDAQARKKIFETFEKVDDLNSFLSVIQSVFNNEEFGNERISLQQIEPYIGSSNKTDPPYLLTNLLDEKKTGEAIKMFYKLVHDQGMHSLQVLSIITSRYKKIVQVKSKNITTPKQVVEIFGGKMKDYPAKLLLNVARRKSSEELANNFKQLHLADARCKGYEGYTEVDAMLTLITELCK